MDPKHSYSVVGLLLVESHTGEHVYHFTGGIMTVMIKKTQNML